MSKKKAASVRDDDALKAYFNQIRKTPLLTFEEELELSRSIEEGDEEARRRLVEANLRLVVKIAKAYVSKDVGLLDLIQEGNLGLLKAASKYDHRKQVRFSTYASWWIKQSITRALSNKRRSIRLPHRKEDALRKIQRAFNVLSQTLSRRPSVEEVAVEVGMGSAEVVEILNISHGPVSLDSDINSESGTLHDVFEDYSYSPDSEIMQQVMRDETLKFLERLREKEKKILLYRFAFHGGKKYTLKRISDEMGISPETVRQIEMRAIRKLRQHASEIEEFVYE
ncbi:MAG: RNA polymerase sigma factor RpoD/SigA [Spirochaetales bacterium]|nr:RNA polymerase sigma factor RpoD/SigA [Spirochaetales bacterium]